MRYAQNIVFKQGVVDIVNRGDNIIRRLNPFCIDGLRVYDIRPENSGDIFLQNMITGLLKIGIQGQIQGVACLRLCPGRNLKRSSEVIDIDRFRSLSSLKIRLHLFSRPTLPTMSVES